MTQHDGNQTANQSFQEANALEHSMLMNMHAGARASDHSRRMWQETVSNQQSAIPEVEKIRRQCDGFIIQRKTAEDDGGRGCGVRSDHVAEKQ